MIRGKDMKKPIKIIMESKDLKSLLKNQERTIYKSK